MSSFDTVFLTFRDHTPIIQLSCNYHTSRKQVKELLDVKNINPAMIEKTEIA